MKQNHLLKSLLLLCALIVGSMNVWATNYTYTLSSGANAFYSDAELTTHPGSSSSNKISQFYASDGKLFQASSSNIYFSAANSGYLFVTSGVKLTLPTYSGEKITQVKLSNSSGCSTSVSVSILSGVNTAAAAQTWSSTSSEYTYNIGASYQSSTLDINVSSKNAQITKIIITTEAEAPAGTTASPTISGATPFLTSTTVSIANAASATGAAIYYTLNGDAPTTTTSATCFAYSAPFTIDATTTVKAIAKHADDTNASSIVEKTFTKVTPMTVAEAIDAIDASSGTNNVYVRGIVCEGGSSLSSGAMNYWISDDGTETKKFEIFRGKGLNGASFTSTSDVKVGDIVVVFGNITKYSSTYEFSAGSQLISHIKKVAAPTFSPAAGAVAAGTTVTISTTTDGATIYYTTDGSTPTTSSSVYSSPITIDAAKTINAFAVKDGCPDSDIATATYTIAVPAATPTFSLAEGTYTEIKTVTITTETDDATIYYTTDGSTPTTESTEYTGAITVDETMTIKAIAAKDGMANSAVASVTYTINLPDYVTLPFSFDDGKSSLPTGLTSSGLGKDYASSPKLKFDDTNDYLVMKTNEAIGTLAFKIKGYDFSGGTFKVQYSVDGSSYLDLASYTTLGDTQVEIFNNVPDDARYIKWIYTSKSSGNVGLGVINVQKYVSITPTKDKTTYVTTQPLDFSGVDGLTAYVATGSTTSAVTLTSVDKVPAGTPLVLKGTASTAYNVPTTAEAVTPATNYLVAGTGAAIYAGDAAHTRYVLSGGVFKKITTTPATVPVGKAYLEINESTLGAPELELNFDGENSDDITTGIDTIEHSTLNIEHSEVYNLNGQRVSQPTKGLYIINGKKVIVK